MAVKRRRRRSKRQRPEMKGVLDRLTLASSTGKLAIPLIDPDTMGGIEVRCGPGASRHHLRMWAQLPTADDTKKMQVPMGYDPDSPTFLLEAIVSVHPMPPGFSVEITTVETARGTQNIHKRSVVPSHRWKRTERHPLYPSFELEAPMLRAGDWIEIWARSRWHRQPELGAGSPPQHEISSHWQPYLSVKTCWRPLARKGSLSRVEGDDPFSAAARAPRITPRPRPQHAPSYTGAGEEAPEFFEPREGSPDIHDLS